MRTIKNGGFCWQDKGVLKCIRQQIEDCSSALCVYLALTIVASDNGSENPFTTTHRYIAELSGVTDRTVRRRLADLVRIGVIKVTTPPLKAACTYHLLPFGHHVRTKGHHDRTIGHGEASSVSYYKKKERKEERNREDSLTAGGETETTLGNSKPSLKAIYGKALFTG